MSNNSTRITALENRVESIEAKIDRLIGFHEAGQPVTPVTQQPAMGELHLRLRLKAHKQAGLIPAGVSAKQAIAQGLMTEAGDLPDAVVAPEAVKVEVPKGPSFQDLRATLKAHKAAGLIRPGVSVKEAIAEGLMLADGSLPTGEPAKQVAEVAVEAPAKVRRAVVVTENHASQGPRDAKGRITPKAEWATREALALSGKFDRHEIDAIVASQR